MCGRESAAQQVPFVIEIAAATLACAISRDAGSQLLRLKLLQVNGVRWAGNGEMTCPKSNLRYRSPFATPS